MTQSTGDLCLPQDTCVGVTIGTEPWLVARVAPFPVEYAMEISLLCEPAPSTARVAVVFTRRTTLTGATAPAVNAFNFPAMTNYAGAIGSLVQCGSAAAAQTVSLGSGTFTAAFTQAQLAGVAAGGTLQSVVIMNTGAGPMTFTGTDGVVTTIPAGGQANWEVDDSRDGLSTFAANATGTTASVVYTYIA